MGARLTGSALYGHLWATDELRAILDERERLRSWLEILATLAEVQAELSIIPTEAAAAIRDGASVDALDLDFVAAATSATGHSTLGLIHGLQRALPPQAREWVYYGGTVAAPAFGEIAKFALPYLEIPPDQPGAGSP